jgi:hypothetical protein
MSTLDELGLKYGTDKASDHHDYLKKYEKYLPFKREDKLRILEIGVHDGPSLRMWKEYFYNSKIIGVDIDPECKKQEEDRIIVEIGNQNDFKFLHYNIGEKYKLFDLIIDDGSHVNEHVIHSFGWLFRFLNKGGVYIIEDACTSYWESFGGGFGKLCTAGTGGCATHGSTIEHFKKLIDVVNYGGIMNDEPFPAYARREDYINATIEKRGLYPMKTDIESINFLNSIIIITKK